LHTRKQKITYQATEKTIELRTQKHKIANQIAAKNNKKITYQIATKITIEITPKLQEKTHTTT